MNHPNESFNTAADAFDSAADDDGEAHERRPPPGPQPLPYAVVKDLFEQLTLAYGQPFLARWDAVNRETVKADWRYKLAGLTPEQLAWGLDHLAPGVPPEAMTFRKWCADMPQAPELVKLPPKRGKVGIPPAVRAILQMHRDELTKTSDEPQRVQWARDYLARFAKRSALTPFQRQTVAHATILIQRWDAAHPKPKEEGHAADAGTQH
jgi:hypothetical protein